MSRKTRKLIWSAPLIAAVAMIGVLAMLVTVAPNGAQAHEAEDHGLPGYVTGLKATANGKTEIKLTWNAPTTGGAPTRYRIDISEEDIDTGAIEGTQKWVAHYVSLNGDTRTNYTDTMGLKPGTTRYYRVFAMNEFGTGPVSFDPTYHFATTVGSGAPDRVPSLSAITVGPNQIDLSWSVPDNNGDAIIRYRIHIQLTDGFPELVTVDNPGDANTRDDVDGIIEVGADVTSYQHKELTENTTYRYVVYATNSRDDSDASDERGATTRPASTPDAPGNLKAVMAANNAVSLYWTWPSNLNGGRFLKFEVAKSADGTFDATGVSGDERYQDAAPNGVAQHVDNGTISLTNGDKVYYRVRTVTLRGATGEDRPIYSSSYGSIDVTVPRSDNVPETPTVVSASDDKLRQIDLVWSALPTTSYLIEAAREVTTGDTEWMRVRNGDTGFSDPTYNHYDLEPAQSWDYRVFPRFGGQYGTPLLIENGMTKAAVASDPVRNLRAEGDGPTKIKVTWAVPVEDGGKSITGYRIEIGSPNDPDDDGTVDANTWPAIADTAAAMPMKVGMADSSTREFTLGGLDAGDVRYFRVVALNGVTLVDTARNAADVARGQTAKAGEPGAPEDLTAEPARDASSFSRTNLGVLLLWNAPDDPAGDEVTGYKIERDKNGAGWEVLAEDTKLKRTYYEDRTHYVAGESWMYRVTARSGTGAGQSVTATYPNLHTTHPPTTAALTAPTGVTATSDTDDEVTVMWMGGDNADRYIVIALEKGSSPVVIGYDASRKRRE